MEAEVTDTSTCSQTFTTSSSQHSRLTALVSAAVAKETHFEGSGARALLLVQLPVLDLFGNWPIVKRLVIAMHVRVISWLFSLAS